MRYSILLILLILLTLVSMVSDAYVEVRYPLGTTDENFIFRETVRSEVFYTNSCPPVGEPEPPHYLYVGSNAIELLPGNHIFIVENHRLYSDYGLNITLPTNKEIEARGGHGYLCRKVGDNYITHYTEISFERVDNLFNVSVMPNVSEIKLEPGETASITFIFKSISSLSGSLRLYINNMYTYPLDCPQPPNSCIFSPWGAHGPYIYVHANTTYIRPGETIQYNVTIHARDKPGNYKLNLGFYFVPDGVQLSALGGFKIAGLSLDIEPSGGGRLTYLGVVIVGLFLFMLLRRG